MRAMRTGVGAMRADTSHMRRRIKSLPTTITDMIITGNRALAGLLVAAARLFVHP